MKQEFTAGFAAPMKPDADGKYRWQYDVHLLKEWHIFWLVWRILFFSFLLIFLFVFISDIVNFGFMAERLAQNAKFFGYFLIGITAVSFLAYLIYAAIMGGTYSVNFEMDEQGILHKQIPAQAKKAKKIARAAFAAGATGGSLSTAGIGLNASRTEKYTDFSKVKKVIPRPRKNLIKVNAKFSYNQVYVKDEDFAFVLSYIQDHCPQITGN